MADSWKIDGNCKECRRKKYCSKPCTKNNGRREEMLRKAVMDAMLNKMAGDKHTKG